MLVFYESCFRIDCGYIVKRGTFLNKMNFIEKNKKGLVLNGIV